MTSFKVLEIEQLQLKIFLLFFFYFFITFLLPMSPTAVIVDIELIDLFFSFLITCQLKKILHILKIKKKRKLCRYGTNVVKKLQPSLTNKLLILLLKNLGYLFWPLFLMKKISWFRWCSALKKNSFFMVLNCNFLLWNSLR